ncbi:DUF3429 domain-containing protein [Henriciella mobilis]|uniref:DUF3429 domain-containing protein n=1 Tax=Henriciella mobilis TaxID=2305467 RepID=A0A399RLJ4_9PROT|nr:DUF3429 domain-containing protein [Henriciella mobilis]RIJ30689.1 DUF3429 domain-containing protein [Henriciella mobilis]
MSNDILTFRRAATALTLAGALPFIGLVPAMAALEPPTNLTASFWLMVYATVILSFLGGIRWGLALSNPEAGWTPLAISVLPALAGWVIVPYAILIQQVPSPAWFLAYAVFFALHLGWDWLSGSVPSWFKTLRMTVSVIVIASLVSAWGIRQFMA